MKNLRLLLAATFAACLTLNTLAADAPALRDQVQAQVQSEYASLRDLYLDLHQHPELSFQETNSAARVAAELRKAGFEVTTNVGRTGIVGVRRNGDGPTVLVRSDLDALPVKEMTGVPYASSVIARDDKGKEVPVMHACGHDIHMTCLVGTARVLAKLADQWHGTLVFIGQPAEEFGGGAHAMIADGLFKRFPKPDYCLALHDSAELLAGNIAYCPGYSAANVDTVEIVVKGVGGHGAYPHKTKDPVVLAAQIVVGLQTIISREIKPGDPAVVTVGSIHGGTRPNVIPEEVRLELTVRSYSDTVRQQTLDAIKRIARGEAIAAGIPDDRMPEVKVEDDYTPAVYNDPQLTERMAKVFRAWFGAQKVVPRQPSMGGEDFGEFGRTDEKIPICIFTVGGVRPEAIEENEKSGKALPSLHSGYWAPLPEPTIKAGVTAMTAAVLDLLSAK